MAAAALGSRLEAGTQLLKKFVRFARAADTLSVAEKVYSIAAFLAIVTTFLLVMSIQSVRLQTTYRHMHATSAEAAINVGRINALIYGIVMESRGIYMSGDRSTMKPFADGLIRRNRELAEAVKDLGRTVGDDDIEQVSGFRQRIAHFIEFRQELVRRGLEISPAAAREWGDNDANRTLRSKLNSDLEALERIYRERARHADELANENRYAAAYLFALGLAALLLAGLNVVVMRGSGHSPRSRRRPTGSRTATSRARCRIWAVTTRSDILRAPCSTSATRWRASSSLRSSSSAPRRRATRR
jgi:CHASE3 domain sensor protein